jgi:hypothetical protein
MQYKVKVAVCADIRTKHEKCDVISTENFFLILNMAVRKVTARLLKRINHNCFILPVLIKIIVKQKFFK